MKANGLLAALLGATEISLRKPCWRGILRALGFIGVKENAAPTKIGSKCGKVIRHRLIINEFG
jgi:hypothetical protein